MRSRRTLFCALCLGIVTFIRLRQEGRNTTTFRNLFLSEIRRTHTLAAKRPVDTFNNHEIIYRNSSSVGAGLASSLSCIGETFQSFKDNDWPAPWLFRTCYFKNLCFDTERKNFVFIRSKVDKELDIALNRALVKGEGNLHTLSTSIATAKDLGGGVAIGPISNRWKLEEKMRLKWFPHVLDEEEVALELLQTGYYELAKDTVMVPFHAMKATNLGHIIWDVYLPIFHILRLFDLLPEKDGRLFLMRYVLEGKPLKGSCDKDTHAAVCKFFFNKTLPLMGLELEQVRTSIDSIIAIANGSAPKSKYVCSPQSVAGMGLLSDHGLKLHGEWQSDYRDLHNYGRGSTLLEFRDFMMKNMGLPSTVERRPDPFEETFNIVFSVHSSTRGGRDLDFMVHIDALERHLQEKYKVTASSIRIETYNLVDYTLKEQMQIISHASILITAAGGGAATSLFLPQGASLVLFYNDRTKGTGNTTFTPTQRLDFDYFNNLGYIRTHWLPTQTMNEEADLQLFLMLVEKELRDRIRLD